MIITKMIWCNIFLRVFLNQFQWEGELTKEAFRCLTNDCQPMQTGRRAAGVALFLCAIMLIPLISLPPNTDLELLENTTKQSTPFDQVQKITIGSETGGTDDSLTLSIEDGSQLQD